jgi:hypothetical protein
MIFSYRDGKKFLRNRIPWKKISLLCRIAPQINRNLILKNLTVIVSLNDECMKVRLDYIKIKILWECW